MSSLLDMKREILMGSADGLRLVAEHPEMQKKVFGFYSKPFEGQGRRINRFMLGADPEFVFSNGGEAVYATNLGLRPGLAFGSDQNDRLVELRPHPSRSALEVVASVLAELRWMHRLCPRTHVVAWVAGAFQHGDGLGGHVHFGRKRPALRSTEVQGLDGLAKTLKATGSLFPVAEWDRRLRGDAHGQIYGRYGDIREQRHGYEYRTLPSWMDSPKLAFLVLTLSKLVIVDPAVTANWTEDVTPGIAFERLRGLANLYRGRDDDAWLLSSMMRSATNFVWHGGCFQTRWGLSAVTEALQVDVYPQTIEPAPEDIADLSAHFISGGNLPMRQTEPNFVYRLPRGYLWMMPGIVPNRRPGIGDLVPDVVTHERAPVVFDFPNHDAFCLSVPASFSEFLKLRTLLQEFPGATVQQGSPNFTVVVGRHWRTGHALTQVRSLLLDSGLFPLWRASEVTANSFAEWNRRQLQVTTRADKFKVAELFPQAA